MKFITIIKSKVNKIEINFNSIYIYNIIQFNLINIQYNILYRFINI